MRFRGPIVDGTYLNFQFQTYEVIKMFLLTRKQRVIVEGFPVSFVFFHLLILPLLLRFANTIPSLFEGLDHLAPLFYE